MESAVGRAPTACTVWTGLWALALCAMPHVGVAQDAPAPALAPMSVVGRVDGTGLGHVRFVLDPGWKTYAPDPGPVGVEPVVSVNGSRNVAYWYAIWPPSKTLPSYGESFRGYDASLDVEVHVQPVDLGQGARLVLGVFAASCAHLCIPLEADVVLVFPPVGGGT